MFSHGLVLDSVTGGMQLFGAGPSYVPSVPHRPSQGVLLDVTATLECFKGIWLLPMILETQRLTENSTDVSGVPGGEGLPSRARYRLSWVSAPDWSGMDSPFLGGPLCNLETEHSAI